MNSFIERLNFYGETFFSFAGPMLWQSTLLIAILFVLDRVLRRRVSAAIRYTLWLVVLLKLLLPPSLAVPGSVAWWVRSSSPEPAVRPYVVSYPSVPPTQPDLELSRLLHANDRIEKPVVSLSRAGLGLLVVAVPGLSLLAWVLVHWWQVARLVRGAKPAPESLVGLLVEIHAGLGLKSNVALRLTDRTFSPAVCGLIWPTILLPRRLAEKLPADQLRAVLLHELVHVRRGDVWINFLQTLLQMVYWWNPTLWLANAQIRRRREEAVDDAVMLALREDADAYVPTLLEVAKLALKRPLASLALVGILESRNALRQRIERLVHFIPPGRAGLSIVSLVGIAAFTALAVPMGQPPAPVRSERDLMPHFRIRNTGLNRIEPFLLSSNGPVTAVQKPSTTIAQLNRSVREEHTNTGSASETATGARRQAILKKLDTIRFDSFSIESLPLKEVVRLLGDQLKQIDRTHQGIDFYIDNYPENATTEIDPSTGWPANPGSSQPTNGLDSVVITIQPALTRVKLVSVLDAIVKAAGRPIRYSIWDRGIVFYEPSEPLLKIRTYKIDLKKFRDWVGPVAGGKSEWGAAVVRKLLGAAGVDYRQPPVNVYINETEGTLMIRGTVENLDAIERTLQSLNPGPTSGELRIQTYRVDVDTMISNLEIAGLLSWTNTAVTNNGRIYYVRNSADPQMMAGVRHALTNLFGMYGVDFNPARGKNVFWNGHEGTLVVRASARDLNLIDPVVASLGTLPPQINIKAKFVTVPEGFRSKFVAAASRTNLSSNHSDTNTVILDPSTTASLIKELEKSGGDLLNESSVVTLSSRQVQIQVIDMMTYMAGSNTSGSPFPGIVSAGPVSSNNPGPLPATSPVPSGPTLDIIPTVKPDGHNIGMELVATIVEFLGYDKPATTTLRNVTVPAGPPLPHFRVQQFSSTITARDGQTVVFSGLVSGKVQQTGSAKAPVYYDPNSHEEKRQVLVLVTPTLLDSAGNRLYADSPSR